MEPLELIATGFLVGTGIGIGGAATFLVFFAIESLMDKFKNKQ